MIDDADAIGEFLGDVKEVSREKDSDAGPAPRFQFLLHDPRVFRIETHHRFIDDDDFGLVQQGRGKGKTLSGAVAEILDPLPRVGHEGKPLHQLGRALLRQLVRHLEEFGNEAHELHRIEFVVKLSHVGDVADATFRLERIFLDVVAADFGETFGRFDETGEQFDRRRFPRGIGSEKGEELPLRNEEIESIEGEEIAVAHRESGNFNHINSSRNGVGRRRGARGSRRRPRSRDRSRSARVRPPRSDKSALPGLARRCEGSGERRASRARPN